MEKIFKVEALYKCSNIYYAVYKKRFLFGWKFIAKFAFKEDAIQTAKELSKPPEYIKYKK